MEMKFYMPTKVLVGKDIIVRNPFSTRPYQHVLEPLYIYLEICEKQYKYTYIQYT